MKNLNSLKIKSKLIAIILLITTLALAIAFVSFIFYGRSIFQKSLEEEIDGVTKLTANNIAVALGFLSDDYWSDLESLVKMPAIKSCYVYNNQGKLLDERHQVPSEKSKPPRFVLEKEHRMEIAGEYIYVYAPLISKGDYFGTLYVRASQEKITKKIEDFVFFMVLVVIVLIILSVILATRLQGIISVPILDLVSATMEISQKGNYSIRVQKKNNDEIGMLYDEFNSMMAQIQERDTQRDKVKNQLRSSQYFLSSVIDSMPSLLIAVDQEGKISQWNKSAARLTGINGIDAVGKNLWELLPEFRHFRNSIEKITRTKKTVEFYKEFSKLHGNPFYFNGSIYPLIDSSEIKFIILLNNVTDVELKEQQLRQSQKMETVGNLAGGLAHDFNNVLGGIIGTISLYKYKTAKNKEITPGETGKYFNTIEEASNRAADMVKHLLSLTRKQDLTFAPIDLNETIQHVVKICRNTFDKSVELDTCYFKGKAMANADATQVEQSLLNLCLNASHSMTIMRKDSEKTGGTLSISLKKILVDKYFRAQYPEAEGKEYWDISVSDTGIGMSQRTLAKIFDPFFTTKRAGSGTGLGLAMVYNIIKQHKGFIKVYSQEGFGSTFHIYLAALEKESVPISISDQEMVQHGEGVILVVDDDEVMRRTGQSILMECGYTVLLAENGQEALEIYKKHQGEIKALLLDMVMPKMSGKETFLELIKINKDIKVILSSGFKQDERVESILKLGVKEFVQKPFTLTTIANAFHRVLNSK